MKSINELLNEDTNKFSAILSVLRMDKVDLSSKIMIIWAILPIKHKTTKAKALSIGFALFCVTLAALMTMNNSGRSDELFALVGILAIGISLLMLIALAKGKGISESADRRVALHVQGYMLTIMVFCMFFVPNLDGTKLIVHNDDHIIEQGTCRSWWSMFNPTIWTTINPFTQHIATYPSEIKFDLQTDQGTVEFMATTTADPQTLYYEWGEPRTMSKKIHQLVQTELHDNNRTLPPEYPKVPIESVLRYTYRHLPEIPGIEPNHLKRKS